MTVPDGFAPLEEGGPFIDLVGPVYARGEGAERVLALRIEDRHRNIAGKAHGGLLATLVDFSLGRAVAEADAAGVTVSLTTDYLKAVEPGDWVEAHTEVEKAGETLAFADCSLTVDGREVVRARAVFAVAG
ncbi:MAG TPA: PaaI family thioesterase [Thermoleophilaceae bacterium]